MNEIHILHHEFVLTELPDGKLEFIERDSYLNSEFPLDDLIAQVDWEGAHWPGTVLVVGVRTDDGWQCASYDNVADEPVKLRAPSNASQEHD